MNIDMPLNEYPLYVTPEHLGGDATWRDAERMAALLRARGWDVRVEPTPRSHAWHDEPRVDIDDWNAAWDECLDELLASRGEAAQEDDDDDDDAS